MTTHDSNNEDNSNNKSSRSSKRNSIEVTQPLKMGQTNTDINELILSLPDLHKRFEESTIDNIDLDNFIKYVNILIYLKKKAISPDSVSSTTPVTPSSTPTITRKSSLTSSPTKSSSSSSLPIPSSPTTATTKASINDVFIYIEKLKKSPLIASDLFEISCSNPVLVPMGPINRVDHYNPVSIPKFNQAVYYNFNGIGTTTTNIYGSGSNNLQPPHPKPSSSQPSQPLQPQQTTLYGNVNTTITTTTTTTTSSSSSSTTTSTAHRDRASSAPVGISIGNNNILEINGLTLSQNTLLPNLSHFQIGTSPPLPSFINNQNNINNINNNNNNNNNRSSLNIGTSSPLYLDDDYNPNENNQPSSPPIIKTTPSSSTTTTLGNMSDSCGDLHFEKLSLSDLEELKNKFPSPTTTASGTGDIGSLFKKQQQQEEEPKPTVRNWSLDFWSALQMDHNCGNENLKRSQKIQAIAEEFVNVATKHGMTIIAEKSKSSGWTIPPYDVGGVAGGLKYLKDGIFFKFAVDVYGIYGGDAFAMKSAGHELKGLMAYFNCQIDGLFLPLMTLIDFMGYRLIATSQLNIDGDKTLVYGSNDGGETVYNKSLEMEDKMKQAGEILNLKGHFTGQGEGKTFIYGPCDIEGHITLDNHFVVIDTARVFPPEKPIAGKTGSHLYTLLRPELVRSSKMSLSSDAFTKFAGPDRDKNNEEVEKSQKRLLNHIIPSFVLLMNQKVKKTKCKNIMDLSANLMLIDSMHREGINVRYLQRLKKTDIHSIDQRLSTIINTEIIARKIKNRLRSFQRSLPDNNRESICKFLNRMMCISLLQSCDLDGFSLELLLSRISQMTGIVFKSGLYRLLSESSECILPDDIISITPKVKFLHSIPYQQGVSLFHQAISQSKSSNTSLVESSDKTFQAAAEKFKLAIQSKPDDYEILTHWGILLSMRAKLICTKVYIKAHGKAEIEKLYQLAIEKFQQAVKIKRNHHYALYNWADALKGWASIKSGTDASELEKKAKMKLKEAGVFEKKWFFGTLETNGAASLLSGKEAGSFIIRNSNSRPGSFVFSYLSDPHRKILHSIIKSSSHGYHVENLPARRISSSSSSSGSSSSGRSSSSTNLNELLLSSSTGSSTSSNGSSNTPTSSPSISRSSSINNLAGQEIKFNEAGTTIPTRNSTSLSSQSPITTTISYKTLEEFVSDKIKQGYIPITIDY